MQKVIIYDNKGSKYYTYKDNLNIEKGFVLIKNPKQLYFLKFLSCTFDTISKRKKFKWESVEYFSEISKVLLIPIHLITKIILLEDNFNFDLTENEARQIIDKQQKESNDLYEKLKKEYESNKFFNKLISKIKSFLKKNNA